VCRFKSFVAIRRVRRERWPRIVRGAALIGVPVDRSRCSRRRASPMWHARNKPPARSIIQTLVMMPLVLPPVAPGLG
jgi:hypothetical protein